LRRSDLAIASIRSAISVLVWSEFVLDTALTEAESTLAERRQFSLNDEEWDAFQVALDAPPSTHPRLQQLLNTPSVFVGEACT
jgi:uncharacterized protein (DUF1778 family)